MTQSYPPADALLGALSRVPYATIARRVFNFLLTAVVVVAAVAVALSHLAREYWREHGEEIAVEFAIFIERVESAINTTYRAGQEFRPIFNRYLSLTADRAYFFATGL